MIHSVSHVTISSVMAIAFPFAPLFVGITDRDWVYVDPQQSLHCGIALVKPHNIWGLSLPPEDWYENLDREP